MAGQRLKARALQILTGDSWANRLLAGLIIINLVAVIFETVEDLSAAYGQWFRLVEYVSVAIFTVEYLGRVWACTMFEEYEHPVWGRLRYALTPLALADLLAITPFYLPMFVTLDLRSLRSLRLLRMVRILKMGRYSKAVRLVFHATSQSRDQLGVVLVVLGITLVLACSFMYLFENSAQPEVFSSIPATLWWGVVTLTTVGYGDVYPVTVAGKTLAAVVAFLGIGMFALPAGIISSAFIEEIGNEKEPKTCPHCGRTVA